MTELEAARERGDVPAATAFAQEAVAAAGGEQRQLSIHVNGEPVMASSDKSSASASLTQHVAHMARLVPGDEVTLGTFHSGANAVPAGNYTKFNDVALSAQFMSP